MVSPVYHMIGSSLTLFAVATSNVCWITRLRAVFGLVPLLITVAAFASILGTFLGEVAHLATLATFYPFGRAGLCTLIGLVSGLLAVTTGKRIVTGLVAIASAVSLFVTIDTLDGGTLNFCLLLRTPARNMAQFYSDRLGEFGGYKVVYRGTHHHSCCTWERHDPWALRPPLSAQDSLPQKRATAPSSSYAYTWD